jgi:hypothetical protein
MATNANEVTAPKVNRSAASAIAAAVSAGLKQVGGTGSLLTQCVTVANQHYKGKPMPSADIVATLEILTESQKWRGRSATMRQSEYRAVLKNYSKLSDAMKEYKAKAGHCSWHEGIGLARLLNGGKTASQAATAYHTNRKAKAADPAKLSAGEAKGAAAKLLKRVLKMVKLPKDFRDSLKDLCAENTIKV